MPTWYLVPVTEFFKTLKENLSFQSTCCFRIFLVKLNNAIMCFELQWSLSKADTYRTELFVRFREVSAFERFELKISQI